MSEIQVQLFSKLAPARAGSSRGRHCGSGCTQELHSKSHAAFAKECEARMALWSYSVRLTMASFPPRVSAAMPSIARVMNITPFRVTRRGELARTCLRIYAP